LSIETFYANESIIGYTYNITLTGYAASKQDRNQDHIPSIGYVVGSIAKIQNIFDNVGNGGKLIVTTPGTGAPMMIFKGGKIKSINFAPSNNQWVKYSEYTIELEFNDVELFGCNHSTAKGCDSSLFDAGGNSEATGLLTVQSQLVDHGANSPVGYKIKSFSDKFTMDLQDEIYDLMQQYKCFANPVVWGGGDANLFKKEAKEKFGYCKLFGHREIDLKTIYSFFQLVKNEKLNSSLKSTLNSYKLNFEGTQHRAVDDARNTLSLFFAMILHAINKVDFLSIIKLANLFILISLFFY
jgi:hypothetical protein